MVSDTQPSIAKVDIHSLRTAPLLADLPEADLARVAAAAELRTFEDGAVLIGQGDVADALYIVEAGTADVIVRTRDGQEQVIDTLGAGEPAGELGLLTGARRTATVRATGSVTAIMVPRDAFLSAMERRGVAQNIATELAERLAARTRARSLAMPPLSRLLFNDR